METGEVLYEKVYMSPRPPPKISLRHDWTKEFGSKVVQQPEGEIVRQPEGEVVRQTKFFQSTQPTPNPIRDRLGRLDDMQDERNTSFPQEINVNSFNEELAKQLYKVSTPCIDDHHFKEEEMKSVGKLSQVCSQIVLKSFFLARNGRPDILWSVNKHARSITKLTRACDKRLRRLISYIHHTCKYRQYCHVGNTAKQCRLGLFQDSDFAGDLEDSKIHFWRNIVHFWKSYICSDKLDVQETDCRFAQFNRIRNHFLGRWIEIRRDSCSGIMGSNCFCFWKRVSDFR